MKPAGTKQTPNCFWVVATSCCRGSLLVLPVREQPCCPSCSKAPLPWPAAALQAAAIAYKGLEEKHKADRALLEASMVAERQRFQAQVTVPPSPPGVTRSDCMFMPLVPPTDPLPRMCA
jgi:hypothetical protein